MLITKEEYDKQFKQFLSEKGSNPGTTFFSSWGWYAHMQNEFEEIMKQKGYIISDD